jgi:hypothetical protein
MTDLDGLRRDLAQFEKANRDRYHELRSRTEAVAIMVEIQKRQDIALAELDTRMNDAERDVAKNSDRLDNHRERLVALENLNVSVLASQVKDLRAQVRYMTISFVGMIVSILVGVIVFLATAGPP